MKKPRIYVDFNELLEENLVMLSQENSKCDSVGNIIYLSEGLKIGIYMDDVDQNDKVDNLIADGIVEKNEYQQWSIVKWNCRIDERGIYHESKKSCK